MAVITYSATVLTHLGWFTAITYSGITTMTLPRDVHASRQGQHDYSLINTLSYLYDGRVRREKLMYHLLSSYKRRWDLFDLLTLGLDEEQMDHLIGDVLLKGHYARHYPLNIHTPFRYRSRRTRQILSDINDWLAPSENQAQRVVILGTTWHWSVVIRTDSTRLFLFDSLGIHSQRRDTFSIQPELKRHTLLTDAIYFVEREF